MSTGLKYDILDMLLPFFNLVKFDPEGIFFNITGMPCLKSIVR